MKTQNSSDVLVFLIAACNHWVAFIAHKVRNNVEMIYLDSRNIAYLDWSDEQKDQYV